MLRLSSLAETAELRATRDSSGLLLVIKPSFDRSIIARLLKGATQRTKQ